MTVVIKTLGTVGDVYDLEEEGISGHRRNIANILNVVNGPKLLLDLGESYQGKWKSLQNQEKFDAVMISHLHDDHALGLKGAEVDIPVFVNEKTKKLMEKDEESWGGIKDLQVAKTSEYQTFKGLRFKAFEVQHSTKSPNTGFVFKSNPSVGYFPDVIFIKERNAALNGLDILISDLSTVDGEFVRKIDGELVGHANGLTIAGWAKKHKIPILIFTGLGPDLLEEGADEHAWRKLQVKAGELTKVFIAKDEKEFRLAPTLDVPWPKPFPDSPVADEDSSDKEEELPKNPGSPQVPGSPGTQEAEENEKKLLNRVFRRQLNMFNTF